MLVGLGSNLHCGMILVGRVLMKRRSKTPKNRDSSNAWSCCGCSLGSKKVVAIGRLDVRVKRNRSSIAFDEVLGMKGNRMSRGWGIQYCLTVWLTVSHLHQQARAMHQVPLRGRFPSDDGHNGPDIDQRARLTSNKKSHWLVRD